MAGTSIAKKILSAGSAAPNVSPVRKGWGIDREEDPSAGGAAPNVSPVRKGWDTNREEDPERRRCGTKREPSPGGLGDRSRKKIPSAGGAAPKVIPVRK